MRGLRRTVLPAALAACACGGVTIGSASAATIEDEATAMLAIYGNPGSNGAGIPVGGGLGRNFGFGKNMLFQACGGCTTPIGANLKITLKNAAKTVVEAKDSLIGGTLMSNKTGANNPLSFEIQFADFQFNTAGGVAVPSYSDTSDRPWIAEICSPAAAAGACRTSPSAGGPAGGVKIENVSFDLGPGVVVQGSVWGVWANSPEAGKPPCITLNLPPAGLPASDTLYETQGTEVGVEVEKVEGTACLISANNDWYVVGGTSKTPAIKIANT